jgi:hypothetical protein
MRVLLAGMVLVVCAACAFGRDGGERLELYHLEVSIGPPGADGELRCGPPRPVCPGVLTQPPAHVVRYEVRGPPAVTDDEFDRTAAEASTDRATGAALVSVPLTAEGTRAFARLTKEVARIGARDQGWDHVAVVVGDEIVAFPEVDFDVYPDGIAHARSLQITAANATDGRELVQRLRGD